MYSDEGKSKSNSADDLAKMLAVKRSRVVFTPTDKMPTRIESRQESYRASVFDPYFSASIPVCMKNCSSSKVRDSPPEFAPDGDFKFQTDTDNVNGLQKEIIRLVALNRALVKLSEVDEI